MDMAGYIGHRGDYHEEFLRRVRELGIEIRMGCNVTFGVALGEERRLILYRLFLMMKMSLR
jgi:hypothetical protein